MELLERRPLRRQRREDWKVVVAEDATSIHDLSDDLLWRILLGLDSPLWLIRASCACKRWRRIVTGEGEDADQGRAFLRLARSLHPPIIVGHFSNLPCSNYIHRFVPTSPPSAPIDSSRFVDDRRLQKSHYVVDCHGGLVLLRLMHGSDSGPSHIVYDPLKRQHHAIPRPSTDCYVYGVKDTLLLNGDDGYISISNFRVIYWFGAGTHAPTPAGPRTCVFSTANGQESWRFLSQPADAGIGCLGQLAGRVGGCLYVGLQTGSVMALNNNSLTFSKVDLPIRIRKNTSASTFTVLDGGASTLGRHTWPAIRRTVIVHVHGEQLDLFSRVHGNCEWVLEHSIPNLLEATRGLSICLEKDIQWMTMVEAISDGRASATLSACSLDSYNPNNRRRFFSLDVNTMKLRVFPQEICRVVTTNIFKYYMLPWPQFLRACPCS